MGNKDKWLHSDPSYPHFAYVTTNSCVGPPDPSFGYRAVCPCGWHVISLVFSREQAQEAADAHNAWYRRVTSGD